MNISIGEPKASVDESTYQEHFVVEGQSLTSEAGMHAYKPDQIEIITYFKVNVTGNPDENSIVYLIDTFDGRKGMLTYKFDVFTDCKVYDFLKEYVECKNRINVENL